MEKPDGFQRDQGTARKQDNKMASETHTELLVADKPLYAKRVRGLHSERSTKDTLTRKYATAAYNPRRADAAGSKR